MILEINHVGVSVIDLEKSISFYKNVMGMEIEYRAYHEGEAVSRVVGVKGAILNICVVRKGLCRIELIDYKNKKLTTNYKSQNESGLVHICFSVKDIDREYERIKGLGYEFNSPPLVTRKNGPKIAYFRGPDNVIIELYEKSRI